MNALKRTVAVLCLAASVVALCFAMPWPSDPLSAAADGPIPPRNLDGLLGVTPTPAVSAGAGERDFWVQASDDAEGYVSRHFVLAGRTRVFRVWAEDSTEVGADLMLAAARELEAGLRRGLLGTLWRATKARGIDAAPIDLVFTRLTGAGGYFTSADQPGSYADPHSNRANVIYVTEAACQLGVICTAGLPAHELQHLLLYLLDPREPAWISEGLSEVAELQASAPSDQRLQLECTDFPLMRWTDDGQAIGLYYAGAGDLLRYWAASYGASALGGVAVSPTSGSAAFDTYLSVHHLPGSFDDAFLGWEAEQASLALAESTPENGILPARGVCESTSVLTLSAGQAIDDAVSPYGCDRLDLDGDAALTVRLTGQATAAVVPAAPHSGKAYWWANRAGQSQTTLTRPLDLRQVQAATLSFWLWYDIEDGYDWGYAAVSTDDGDTWHLLASEDTRADDPIGTGPGVGYTGDSGGWRQQTVDLSPYAGDRVLLQFGYLTDDAVEYAGMAVDDVSVPEIGLADSMEATGDWVARGFELESTERPLRQRYGATLVTQRADGYESRPLLVGDDGAATWVVPAACPGERRAIVLCGLTEAAAEPAPYHVVVEAR